MGWIRASVGALLLSCPIIVFGASNVPLLLLGLLLFQTTMPVTLTAVARLMPRSLATAFGWTCLALVIGALPTMVPATQILGQRQALLGWILLGAASVGLGLRLVAQLDRSSMVLAPNRSSGLPPGRTSPMRAMVT